MILLQSHLFIILSSLFTISQQEPIQCINIEDCIESFRELGISVLTFLFSIWGYTVLHLFTQLLFWVGKQNNHQNFDPSLLPKKLWLIFMRMKHKKVFLEKKKIKMADSKKLYTLHVISLNVTGNPCKFCIDISKN